MKAKYPYKMSVLTTSRYRDVFIFSNLQYFLHNEEASYYQTAALRLFPHTFIFCTCCMCIWRNKSYDITIYFDDTCKFLLIQTNRIFFINKKRANSFFFTLN
jgi:hypothetical protein